MTNARQFVEVLSQLVECEPLGAGAGQFSKPGALYPNQKHEPGRTTSRSKDLLADAIESEIIPRLMLSHRMSQSTPGSKRQKKRILSAVDVSEFARLVVQHDVGVSESYVDILRKQGIGLEAIFMELLAPAAKHLGELWLSDNCTFFDVTIGLSRIHQLVHKLSHVFESEGQAEAMGRSALLVPVPGEQHGLGLLLVEEFFRRDGWDVWAPNRISGEEVVRTVSEENFDVAGFSVTCGVLFDDLTSVIQAIRQKSRNRNIFIMVGGRFVNEHPEFVERVGADATDADGSQAPRLLDTRHAQLHRP